MEADKAAAAAADKTTQAETGRSIGATKNTMMMHEANEV